MAKYGEDLDFSSMPAHGSKKEAAKEAAQHAVAAAAGPAAVEALSAASMRCGGCGAKVSGTFHPFMVQFGFCKLAKRVPHCTSCMSA